MEPARAVKPLLFVISGPSGSGKGTALGHLAESFPEVKRITTYTTRPPRPTESAGVDYRYVTEEEFSELCASGEIYESAHTYHDYAYGSPRCLIQDADPAPLMVELEVRGMLRLRASSERRVVSIFVMPVSIPDLMLRIEQRHLEGNLKERMDIALDQTQYALAYDYVLVNDDRDRFLRDLEAVVRAELLRSSGQNHALSDKFRHG